MKYNIERDRSEDCLYYLNIKVGGQRLEVCVDKYKTYVNIKSISVEQDWSNFRDLQFHRYPKAQT